MGFIVKRIPFANGVLGEKTPFDYYAYFEEKDAFKKKERYKSVNEALLDGCKCVFQDREGMKMYHIVEGVNPDLVSKVWEIPRNSEEANATFVRYYYTSDSQGAALKWFAKNLPQISSPYGINVNLQKFNEQNFHLDI